ncbi:hypothetical protein HID58_077202, partial [Brassica napus]
NKLCFLVVTAPHYGSFFWNLAYNGNIEPVPDMSTSYNVPDAIATMKVHPLMTRRLPVAMEWMKLQKPRKKAKRHCTRCLGHGHNRATCKNPI